MKKIICNTGNNRVLSKKRVKILAKFRKDRHLCELNIRITEILSGCRMKAMNEFPRRA